MRKNKDESVPRPVRALVERFERWRRSKANRGTPIPPALWRRAVVLAQRFDDVGMVARELGLSQTDLRKRVAGKPRLNHQRRRRTTTAVPRVVKLAPVVVAGPPAPQGGDLMIEIEGANGCRLRAAGGQAEAVIRAFVEACR